MKKKGLFTVFTFVFMCMFIGTVPVQAATEYITSADGEWEYTVENGEIELQVYNGNTEHLDIPEYMDGYVVSSMGNIVFHNNYVLKSVELPATLWSMYPGAFSTAYALESITVDGGTKDGWYSVDGVLFLEDKLFTYPAAKVGDSYSIEEGITSIAYGAFYGCSNLNRVVVAQSVESIHSTAFSRSKVPLNIVIKRDNISADYLEGACWEMAAGTRFLVKSEELRDAIIPELKDTECYIDSNDVITVDVYDSVPATDLTFKDGSREMNIQVEYNPDGTSNDNFYYYYNAYIQTPVDTTEAVHWEFISGDEDCCRVTDRGFYAKAGGQAVIKGTDESGHELIMNVTILSPMKEFAFDKNSLVISAGETTKLRGTLNMAYSWAFTKGVSWEIDNPAIAAITSHGKNTSGYIESMKYYYDLEDGEYGRIWCNLSAYEVGETTLHATVYDNGEAVTKSISVKVTDTMDNCSADAIPAQGFTGSQIMPETVIRYKGYTLMEGKDYTLTYGENLFGRGEVVVTGEGLFYGKKTIEFDIIDNIKNCTIGWISTQNRSDILAGKYPEVTVSCGTEMLVEGEDYKLEFGIADENSGYVNVTGIGEFTGEKTAYFKIVYDTESCREITADMVYIEPIYPQYQGLEIIKGNAFPTRIYTTGADILKTFHVTDGKNELAIDKAYTISLHYNGGTYDMAEKKIFAVGEYELTVKGIKTAGYTGSVTVLFTIYDNYNELLEELNQKEPEPKPEPEPEPEPKPVTVKNTKIKSVKSKAKKAAVIKWKKVSGANGYEIQCATNKKFAKNKKTVVVKKNVTSKTIKKLKSQKKYYIRIRAYKVVSGEKYYSDWCSIKTLKIK